MATAAHESLGQHEGGGSWKEIPFYSKEGAGSSTRETGTVSWLHTNQAMVQTDTPYSHKCTHTFKLRGKRTRFSTFAYSSSPCTRSVTHNTLGNSQRLHVGDPIVSVSARNRALGRLLGSLGWAKPT